MVSLLDDYDKLIFDVVDANVKREFGRMLFAKNHWEVESYMRMEVLAMVVELRTYLMTRRHESEDRYNHYYEVPHTWWDHFKLQYFPDWLINRFPVKFDARVITIPQAIVHNMCPHANIKWDKRRGPHITFLETGEYYPDRASNSRLAVP